MDTTFKRANKVAAIEISEIVQISEAAAERKRAGEDVISLGTGEPDFGTPEHIQEAAIAAMRAGETRYPPTRGTTQLHAAVCGKYQRDNGLDFDTDQVIVSTGAKQVLYNAFSATLDEGDEVIVPAPFWTTYADIIRLCGGIPVIVPCGMQHGFKITPQRLTQAITPRTRWLLINTPGNPSGAMYSTAEWQAIGAVLEQHPAVWLMADEIYEHLVYAPVQFHSVATVLPQLSQRTLLVNGVSKAYAMTGWRIGFGIGPAPLISAMTAVQGQITSGACSISQAAAVAALNGPQSHLTERLQEFESRRNYLHTALNQIKAIDCPLADGAFYLFPSCQATFGMRSVDGSVIRTDADFCDYMLRQQALAVVPGRAFGCDGHFRLSYAYAQADLALAVERIARGCEALLPN